MVYVVWDYAGVRIYSLSLTFTGDYMKFETKLIISLIISTIVCVASMALIAMNYTNRVVGEQNRHNLQIEAIEATRSAEVRIINEK